LEGWLRSSVSASTKTSRKAMPTISSMDGPIMLDPKQGAGKVAKMLNIGVESAAPPRVPRVKLLTASKLEMAWW
jgi:hypothetical protein